MMRRTIRWAVQRVQANEQGLQNANATLERLLRRDLRNDLLLDCATAAVGGVVARSCRQALQGGGGRGGGAPGSVHRTTGIRLACHAIAACCGTAVFLRLRRLLGVLGLHTGTGSARGYLQLALPTAARAMHDANRDCTRTAPGGLGGEAQLQTEDSGCDGSSSCSDSESAEGGSSVPKEG